jgi:hypothetical protein
MRIVIAALEGVVEIGCIGAFLTIIVAGFGFATGHL